MKKKGVRSKFNNTNQWPKHWAIDKGHKAIARMLIERGAALDIQDKFGHSGEAFPLLLCSLPFTL